nr:Hsp33 family molecular chaperone HslO [Maliibacterium massiliense]
MKQDTILRATLADDQVSVLLARTTHLVEDARKTFDASPLATAVLGRTLTMTAMMALSLKNARDSITVTLAGGGLIGKVVAVGRPGPLVKGYVDDPRLELPLNEQGKLDVGWAVGRDGMLTVVRDLGLRDPYVGQARLQTGEIGDDFAFYFTVSEQTPSMVALGVLADRDGMRASGGLLVQPLPGCNEDVIARLEQKAKDLANISALVARHDTARAVLEALFSDMDPRVLQEQSPHFACDCSRERVTRALVAMGEQELTQLIEEDHKAELTCHFCNRRYAFDERELRDILQAAKAR